MNYDTLDTLVDSYRDELIENIRRWIAIPSVKGEPAGAGAPFGSEVRRMLDTALKDGRRFGFETRDIDGYAGDITMGEGPRTMGILAHLDVVPLGDGWKHDPLGGEIDGGKLYGRGSTDDKGPALCALYAMRAVKEAGFPLKHAVRLILGCDEETGMSDMRYYAEKMKMPDYGFSPDAEFPVINIEKGGINLCLSSVTGGEARARIPVHSLYAGERPNVVPAEAVAVVGLGDLGLPGLQEELRAVQQAHARFDLRAEAEGEGRARIIATGVNGHAAMPERALNAAGMLLTALKCIGAGGGSREAIAMLADAIGMDYSGRQLGIACADELSGELTCNLGILRYDGRELQATLDIRYPLCADEEQLLAQAARRVAPADLTVTRTGGHPPLHVPAESRIVQGLLKVYHEVTGLPAYTVAIGGGTYSQMMPNTVAFGVCFPGDMDVCHIADEYIDVEKMMLGVKIFAHAIVELAGEKPFSIAIDGPAGAGKSSVARALAQRLGALYLDTGAMYRAFGLYMLRKGAADDPNAAAACVDDVDIRVEYRDGAQHIFLADEDVTSAIREPEVSMAASAVSAVPQVRKRLVALQRRIAAGHSVVMDGRDIGTHVLPDATLKVFLTASAEERARRRCLELRQKGLDEPYEKVLGEMRERDYQDSHRAASPLQCAEDAVVVDTSELDLEQSIEAVMALAQKAIEG